MKTLQSDTINVLNSFTKGQGATLDLSNKLLVSDLTVDYLGGVYSFTFANDAHKDAYLTMLMYKELKDKSPDYIKRLFEHLGSGEYLSLNHTDSTGSTIQADKYAAHKPLFASLGITECRSNGKGSKLVQLLIDNPNEFTVTALVNEGFNNISPLLDGFKVIGLKCELPKIAD
jgi:hypothetical protein